MSGPEDQGFEDELRAMFDDERLGVAPRQDAPETIVAGARRVRRRRAMMTTGSGALAFVALVGGGIALTGTESTGDLPPLAIDSSSASEAPPSAGGELSPPRQTSPPAPSSTPHSSTSSNTSTHEPSASSSPSAKSSTTSRPRPRPALRGAQLGPQGYGALRLGMSAEQAKSSGSLAVEDDRAITGCQTFKLKEGGGSVTNVVVSAAKGVVVFRASGAQTPEGVAVGSPEDDLKGAYPGGSSSGSGFTAPAGSGGSYRFSVSGGAVSGFSLELAGRDCG